MRRIISLVILCSMMLHCASRLGILSYLYQERHSIAHAVGLIQEIPIALCSSDYDFNQGLSIQDHDDSETLPVTFGHAHEITLFAPHNDFDNTRRSHHYLAGTLNQPPYLITISSSPHFKIFQPPRAS
jgi:hypothetical protein